MRLSLANRVKLLRANRLLEQQRDCVVFVTPLLRAREIKLAKALRDLRWKVILLYRQTTPFYPQAHFDIAIRAESDAEILSMLQVMRPSITHLFSGAVDELTLMILRDKPGPVVVDLNDVFCPSLFNYHQERFEPTRECLALADGVCARDLQPKFAERYDGFALPRHVLLFPEYSWRNGPADPRAKPKLDRDDVHVVSVGTFTLETQGMYDSAQLKLAHMLTEQKIHFHIYPHWFYRRSRGSKFNHDLQRDFREFFDLARNTPYLHIHDSLAIEELARELPQYDFGLVSGGSEALGQKLDFLKPRYMQACYSGRISDYLDARLPVIINCDVAFNYKLLERYGLVVDLAGLFKPGFREKLRALKGDSTRAAQVSRAADSLSLTENGPRLVAFYNRIIHSKLSGEFRFPLWMRQAMVLPYVSKGFWQLDAAMREANEPAKAVAEEAFEQSAEALALIAKSESADMLRKTAEAALERLVPAISENKRIRAELQKQNLTLVKQVESLRAEMHLGRQQIDDVAGMLNWPQLSNDQERRNGFGELLTLVKLTGQRGQSRERSVSGAWEAIGRKHFDELLAHGYHNFKRTLALNYFTFPVQAGDPQLHAVEALLDGDTLERCRDIARALADEPGLAIADQETFRYFVALLWSYARSLDRDGILDRIREPGEGNPIVVQMSNDGATQDLANSTLEYYAMREHVDFSRVKSVLEIGAGYGRNAHLLGALHPDVQITIVDIPPALFISQRYLSNVLPGRRVFQPREFGRYDDVAAEMDSCGVVFLLPHQLNKLPAGRFGLTINISSFGEMSRDQIETYFKLIDRVTKGHFYSKQWKVSKNPFDRLELQECDYPVPMSWTKLYSRTCKVQNEFFEALYAIGGPKG